MIQDKVPQCYNCKHFHHKLLLTCDAFGDKQIPIKIVLNERDHRKPFKGDNGIRFEPTTKGK